MAAEFPRLLVISPTVLTRWIGGGVTMSRLLQGWPNSLISQIHSDSVPPDYQLCGTYYRVSNQSYGGARAVPRHMANLVRFALGTEEVALLWSRVGRRLQRWLNEQRPQVIFSQTGNLAFLRLTRAVADYTGAKLVLHASDDWIAEWPYSVTGWRVPGISQRIAAVVRQEYAALVRQADLRFAISEEMRESYSGRIGGDWSVLHNAVDPSEWPDRGKCSGPRETPFLIFYSGSLVRTSQLDAVFRVARAVENLRERGIGVELHIATRSDAIQRFASWKRMGVKFRSLVPQSELGNALAGADMLLLPITFRSSHLKFIRLSLPGKTAEYMMSGTPIFVYGPTDCAVVRDAQRNGWARVVSSPEISAIEEEILTAIREPKLGQHLANRARSLALEKFDIRRIRKEFQRAMREVA